MAAGFAVYIDESGDEGFQFHSDGSGSSRWFVLSAVVTRKSRDHDLIDCLAGVRALLGRPPLFPLHFRELKHEQRVAYVAKLAELRLRTVNVAIHKPSLD